MSFVFSIDSSNKESLYKSLNETLTAVVSTETDWLANLANASALLFQNLPNVNWAGFYLYKENVLVLGPFQGKLACTRINIGKGVCGTAAQNQTTLVVSDVDQFPGHIACDSASQSEIVLPLVVNSALFGVLDIDSPEKNRFDEVDAQNLEKFVAILVQALKQNMR